MTERAPLTKKKSLLGSFKGMLKLIESKKSNTQLVSESTQKLPASEEQHQDHHGLHLSEECLLYVTKPHKSIELDEIELEIGDIIRLLLVPEDKNEFWLLGVTVNGGLRQGQKGYFPKDNVINYVPDKVPSSPEPLLPEIEEVEQIPNIKQGKIVISTFAYEPTRQDELPFSPGTPILVTECPEGGWWKGVVNLDGKNPISGWFPAVLVKAKSKPTLEVQSPLKAAEMGVTYSKSWNKRIERMNSFKSTSSADKSTLPRLTSLKSFKSDNQSTTEPTLLLGLAQQVSDTKLDET